MNNSILDVFYNCLIKEAAVGSVDCYFKYNIRFDTEIREDNVRVNGEISNDDLLIPTLIIKNKDEFNYLLEKYVELALYFYDIDCFPEEVCDSRYFDNELGVSKEKMIMTLLWSNASYEDFTDPCNFLRKRIAFFELDNLEKYLNKQVVGYSKVLDSDIEVVILKNGLASETPYSLKICLLDVVSSERIYEFPKVYFGINNDKVYVYAIQNDRNRLSNFGAMKKIDRIMYKVNDGLDVKEDNYVNYGVGNLKDITPNALVSANILMGLLRANGISKVIVPSILISRWNAKMLVLEKQQKSGKKNLQAIQDDYDKYLYLQSNLTEKFLRVFRRIGYHHSSVMISSYPYELGSNLELSVLDFDDVCNNKLLDETYNLNCLNKRKNLK